MNEENSTLEENNVVAKPKKLIKGDTIGLVSPSSGLWERSELWAGIENLEKRGYKVKLADNVYKKTFYLAGSDEERAKGVMDMFKDDSVDAIFNTQGGYGATRVLKYLDFDVIKACPKIFMGYSDTTALLIAIQQETGLVTFHGPDVCDLGVNSKSEYNFEWLERALTQTEPIGKLEMADKDKYLIKVRGGEIEAPITGGNLDLMTKSIGTKYEINTKGKILFLEEVGVEPWAFDGLMMHLCNAGKLQDAEAFVIGECVDCLPKKINPGYYTERSVEDIIFEILEPLGKPVIMNLPIGHTGYNPSIPLGVAGKVDGAAGTFEILEGGVL